MEHEKTRSQVLYICDGNACKNCSDWIKNGCRHTSDIEHAAHFKKMFDCYVEEDVIVAELSRTKHRKKPARRRLARPRGAGRNV